MAILSRMAALAFQNANGTTVFTLATPVSTGTQCTGLVATTNDTIPNTVNIYWWAGLVDILIASKVIPAMSGYNGNPNVDLYSSVKNAGLFPWIITNGLFRVGLQNPVASGKVCNIVGQFTDLE